MTTTTALWALAEALTADGADNPLAEARALLAALRAQPTGGAPDHQAAHNLMALQAWRRDPTGLGAALRGTDAATRRLVMARLLWAGAPLAEVLSCAALPPRERAA